MAAIQGSDAISTAVVMLAYKRHFCTAALPVYQAVYKKILEFKANIFSEIAVSKYFVPH